MGEIDLRLDIENGYIKNVRIYGDFFGKEPVEDIEERLRMVRYEPYVLDAVIRDIDLELYFGKIHQDNFLELVYGQDE